MVEVDDRGWITISKPEDSSVRGDEVNYYFTITDSNDEPITGYTLTDENDNPIDVPTNEETPDGKTTTLTLKAGQTVKISGLHEGSFRIKQTIVEAPKMAFDVELEDTVKTATEPGKEISITTLGDRTVSISKLGDPADDNNRVYTYKIYQGYGSPLSERLNSNPVRRRPWRKRPAPCCLRENTASRRWTTKSSALMWPLPTAAA